MSEKNEKADFFEALRHYFVHGGDGMTDEYGHPDYQGIRGDRVLAGAFALYLADEAPEPTMGINWFHDLHSHLVDAFEAFRTQGRWSWLRESYKSKTDEDVPDLVNIHIGGIHRMLAANGMARLVAVLSGKDNYGWLRPKLENYFNAQQLCIDQAWERFVRIGYRQLMPRIKTEKHRGNRGDFGETALLTYAMAGRVMFTFKRGEDQHDTQMTYVADESDMHGERSGPNETRTPFMTCIEMINEVSDNWDIDKMKPDTKVGMF